MKAECQCGQLSIELPGPTPVDGWSLAMRVGLSLAAASVALPSSLYAQFAASDESAVKFQQQAEARVKAGDYRTFSYPVAVVYPNKVATYIQPIDKVCLATLKVDYVAGKPWQQRYFCGGREIAREIDPELPEAKALPPLPGAASAMRLSFEEFHVRWFVRELLSKQGLAIRTALAPSPEQIGLVWASHYEQAHPNYVQVEQAGFLSRDGSTVSVGFGNLYKDSYTFKVDEAAVPRCTKISATSVRCQYRIAMTRDLQDIRVSTFQALAGYFSGRTGYEQGSRPEAPKPAWVQRSDIFVWNGKSWSAPSLMPGLRKLAIDLDKARGGSAASAQQTGNSSDPYGICGSAAFGNMFNGLGAKPIRPPGCP